MTTYRRSQDVVCRQVGGESILVPIRHNVGNLDYVYTLSPVAARIWALLDGSRSVEAIADELCSEFEVDSDTAAADVTALLADLASASLISEVR
jgi:Coenzyme PQQ synthesis protein D (PqqD)